MSQFFCIVLLLLTSGPLSAENQQHRVRNIVLVHGAWADGSGWKGVYDKCVKRAGKVHNFARTIGSTWDEDGECNF
jgi:hypothetical protein